MKTCYNYENINIRLLHYTQTFMKKSTQQFTEILKITYYTESYEFDILKHSVGNYKHLFG